MKRLARHFGLIVGALLVGSAITGATGIYGLRRLDASLSAVVSVDMPRLMTITDIRKQVRSLVVAENAYILELDPVKAAAITDDLHKGRVAVGELFKKYEPYLLSEDADKLRGLRDAVAEWTSLDDQVLALVGAQKRAEATSLSKSHSKQWETLIKGLIANADKHLAVTSKATSAVAFASQLTVVIAFSVSTLLGLIAGVLIYRAIRRMVGEIVSLKDRLLEANEGLEQTVQERTRTIRAILDHVSFGFFLVGRDLRITEGHTRSLSALLGREQLAGERAADCLGFPGARGDDFDMRVSQIFDDILPEELSCDQVPARVVRGGQILRIHASAVRGPNGEIHQVLFGVSDVTTLEVAERTNRESQTLLRALKDPEPFRRFVADLSDRFGSVREAVEVSDESRARRELHTIKGNASCYGLVELASSAHVVEETDRIELPPVIELEDEFSRFLRSHVDLLGIEPGKAQREVYRIDSEELGEIEAVLASARDLGAVRDELAARLDRIRWQPAGRLVGPLGAQVESLGQRLGKEVALHVRGGDTSVVPASVMPIVSLLPHMVRNAVDHGLEAPAERGDKPRCGKLEIEFSDVGSAWRIAVRDDGRGIDVERLREVAVKRGVVASDAQLSHDQLCALIFAPKMSTAEVVTDVSGRGEGMAAVAEAVKQVGGSISVTTTPGSGTTIAIDVPKPPQRSAMAAAA